MIDDDKQGQDAEAPESRVEGAGGPMINLEHAPGQQCGGFDAK